MKDQDDDAAGRLPPLSALRAFEAAARHQSFARAAEELGVSPAAVSQHIQTLEVFAGQPLFRRLGRRIELTDAGEAARPSAAHAVELLADAARQMRQPLRAKRVAVSVTPALGAKWLTPRLARFRLAHPAFDVTLRAEAPGADLAYGDLDLAVRLSSGQHEGAVSERLASDILLVVAAPALALEIGPVATPAQLLAMPLIQDDAADRDPAHPTWRTWLAAHLGAAPDLSPAMRIDRADLVLEAAAAGCGVALVSRLLAEADLAAGRLQELFPALRLPLFNALHIVTPRGRTVTPAMRAFTDWLRTETGPRQPDLGAGI